MHPKFTTSKSRSLLIIGAFVLINLIAAFALGRIRLDLTENNLNTLSKGTESILQSLEEPVTLQLYLSTDVMEQIPPLQGYAKQVEDLLEEYQLLSRGKLTIEKVNPLPFSEEEDQAVAAGLQGVPVATGQTLYFGLIAKAAGPQQTIAFFQPEREEFLEYDLSQLIYSVTHPEHKVLGILSAIPLEGGPTGQPVMLIEQLRSQFEVRDLTAGEPAIPEEVDILMVVHPHGLEDKDLYAVDQYVLSGGSTLVFADPFTESNPPQFGSMPKDNPLADKLLEAWGVQFAPGKVVGDPALAQQISYRDRSGRTNVFPYLPWLALSEQNYNQDDTLVSHLGPLNVASAGVLQAVEGSEFEFTPLIKTTEQGGVIDRTMMLFGIDPGRLPEKFSPSHEALVLAARCRGAFATAFPDGEPVGSVIPKKEDKEKEKPEHLAKAAEPANLLIVADTDLLQDRFWVQVNNFFGRQIVVPQAANLDLVTNALEILGGSPDLIGVRNRGSHQRPFELVAEIQQQAELRYRAEEQELLQKLDETERKLSELQAQRQDAGSAQLTAEQQAEVDKFLQEKVRNRKKLREVQYRLRADIDDLEGTLKALNIGLVPLLITLVAFLTWVVRRGRKRDY